MRQIAPRPPNSIIWSAGGLRPLGHISPAKSWKSVAAPPFGIWYREGSDKIVLHVDKSQAVRVLFAEKHTADNDGSLPRI